MYTSQVFDEKMKYTWTVNISLDSKEWQMLVLDAFALAHIKYKTVRLNDVVTLVKQRLDMLDISYGDADPNSSVERENVALGDEISMQTGIGIYLGYLHNKGFIKDLSKNQCIKVDAFELTNDFLTIIGI